MIFYYLIIDVVLLKNGARLTTSGHLLILDSRMPMKMPLRTCTSAQISTTGMTGYPRHSHVSMPRKRNMTVMSSAISLVTYLTSFHRLQGKCFQLNT